MIHDNNAPAVRRLFRDIARAAEYHQKSFEILKDNELSARYRQLKDETVLGISENERMPQCFGLVGEACRRALGMTPYPVQYLAAASLASGEIAQMNTGEGKTLTGILPACFRALEGHGVHVITVNEYLARRDYEWNLPVFRLLGLTVGLSLSGMSVAEKQRAYDADITYTTATEAGFDYLRDGIAARRDMRVQKELYYAIIDEADSILLDEAVTPLILSTGGEGDTRPYVIADTLVRHLKKTVYDTLEDDERDSDEFDGDYVVDLKRRSTFLTAEGIHKSEQYYRISNLFLPENSGVYHYILQAMDAHGILERDVDYIIRDNRVQLVDRNTGRVMDGRRYAAGLHQAVEAKERVEIHPESKTLSEISYQKFFLNYRHLSGMTGTAWSARKEFESVYKLPVRRIPPNLPCIRLDRDDRFFIDKAASFGALTDDVLEAWHMRRPVLIGTPDDKTSEEVSALLHEKGVPHKILGAKQDADEARLIAGAGLPGSVIVATNMAGRGTDIIPGGSDPFLSKEVAAVGGLLVLGACRQRSHRVDLQLAGRTGRQGNPGESRFYVSLEDDLLRLYGNGKADKKAVLRAQRHAQNIDAGQRAAALEADTVLQIHRSHILENRTELLLSERPGELIREMIRLECEHITDAYAADDEELRYLKVAFFRIFGINSFTGMSKPDTCFLYRIAESFFTERVSEAPGLFDEMARSVILQCIDEEWSRFLEAYAELKEGYHLMASSGRKPYQILVESSTRMLEETNRRILEGSLMRVFRCRVSATNKIDL